MAKKKTSSNPVADIFAEVDKEFGPDGLFNGDDDFIANVETITSGSASLDDAMGLWGLPKGRVVQYAGPESSGKTLMAFMAIREWMNAAPHHWAAFYDVEGTYDGTWASALGVDTSRLKVSKKTMASDIFNNLCGIKAANKKTGKVTQKKRGLLDIIEDRGGAEKSGCGIIVVDSIPSMQAPIEEVSAAGKINVAPMARFLPPELRKITPKLGRTGVVLLAINQIRVKIGAMYGNPEDTPGGRAWKHACSMMVNFGAVYNSESFITDDLDEKIGHKIKAKIVKNKVAPAHRNAEFEIKYLSGIVNRHREVFELAVKYGVIERPSTVSYAHGGKTVAKGRDNAIEWFANQGSAFHEQVMLEVMAAKAERVKIVSAGELERMKKDDAAEDDDDWREK